MTLEHHHLSPDLRDGIPCAEVADVAKPWKGCCGDIWMLSVTTPCRRNLLGKRCRLHEFRGGPVILVQALSTPSSFLFFL